MSDAPLFGLRPRRQASESRIYHVDSVLPTRKHSDQLMDIYWQYIHAYEPLVEQECFAIPIKLYMLEIMLITTSIFSSAPSTPSSPCQPSCKKTCHMSKEKKSAALSSTVCVDNTST